MVEEDILLGDILHIQAEEMKKMHQGFSAIIAGGFNYSKSMGQILSRLEKAWELISYAFEAAWVKVDGDTGRYPEAWASLERLELHLRKCLTMGEVTLEKATVLLHTLGLMVSESERCQRLWKLAV